MVTKAKKVEPKKIVVRLDKDAEKQQFAKMGMHIHQKGDVCAFCGNPISDEVFEELFRLSRYGGGELFVEYLQMIAEKSHTDISKIQAYAKAEHDLLFRCKWNTEQKQPHLYSSEER